MFAVVKKRHILIAFFLILVICISIIFATKMRTEYVYFLPSSEYLVVIDAGHGGIDVNIRHKVF